MPDLVVYYISYVVLTFCAGEVKNIRAVIFVEGYFGLALYFFILSVFVLFLVWSYVMGAYNSIADLSSQLSEFAFDIVTDGLPDTFM